MSIQYKLSYCGQDTVWTENYASRLHKSQQVRVEYRLGSNQTVLLECTLASGRTSTATFDMHEVLQWTLVEQKPARPKDTDEAVDMRLKCWDLKQDTQLSKIKFSPTIVFTEPKPYRGKQVMLRLAELVKGKVTPLLTLPEYGEA